MSEQEQEQTQEPEQVPSEPSEPETPAEPTEPEPEHVEPDAEPGPDAEPEQPQEPPSETDAEIEAIYAKLGTKAKNYTKGLGELLEGTGVPVAPCEMCSDAFPGVRWLTPTDETHAMLLAIVGAAGGESPLKDDPDAKLCDRCQGWGATKLPSHVPGNEQRTCRACNGAGYLDPNPQSGAMQSPAQAQGNGEAEVLAGVPETDASVIDLRSRGFTIIPPMRIAEPAQQ